MANHYDFFSHVQSVQESECVFRYSADGLLTLLSSERRETRSGGVEGDTSTLRCECWDYGAVETGGGAETVDKEGCVWCGVGGGGCAGRVGVEEGFGVYGFERHFEIQ